MANRSHLSLLKKGLRGWNRWRVKYPYVEPELRWANLRAANLAGADLRGADLKGADLAGANISEADLSGARLKGADLTGATLVETSLTGADLAGANLNCANLSRALLENANLTGANLFRAILDETNLEGADFSETEVGYTKFSNLDLSAVKGLHTLKHFGPSSIGIDTICISQRKIPGEFLRRAGVPEKLVDYVQGENNAFRFQSCFISYSLKDQAFAEKIGGDLESNGVQCWFAPEKLNCGERIYAQLDQKKHHYRVLLVISEHSIAGRWIAAELQRARQCEGRVNRRCVFPVWLVSLDTISQWEQVNGGSEIIGGLRQYSIQDFSEWENHDSYQSSLEILLKELRECDPMGSV
jgi:uncharacterized protein YjbI with pentapeptide repeats